MTIVHIVTRSDLGGAQSVVRALAEHQFRTGNRVIIVSGIEGAGQAWVGLPQGVLIHTVPRLVRAVHPLDDISALFSIAKLYKYWNPTIVHLHTSKAGTLGRLAWNRGGAPVVYTMHGYDQIRISNPAMVPIDRAVFKYGPGKAEIVAVSQADRAALSIDGYPEGPVIANGIDGWQPHPPAILDGPESTLASLKDSSLPVIMTVARDAPPKRLDIVRDLAKRFRGRAHFVWIGGSGTPDTNGPTEVQDNLLCLGTVTEAGRLFRYADICLLASDHEGTPVSLLEAMSWGVPVVASGVGGIPEVLGQGGGLLVENTQESFSKALSPLISDPYLRQRMGQEGLIVYSQKFTANHMAIQYKELYARLLG